MLLSYSTLYSSFQILICMVDGVLFKRNRVMQCIRKQQGIIAPTVTNITIQDTVHLDHLMFMIVSNVCPRTIKICTLEA